jgi:pimeloyl-ACP methyl ester carboxylesterase
VARTVRVMRRAVLWSLAVAAVLVITIVSVVVVQWLGQFLLDTSKTTNESPTPIRAAVIGGATPGSLVSAMTMPGFTRTADGKHLQAARVVYRSTEGDTGAPTVVSGSVFTPLGPPPAGGWPVVAYGHGTTGIDKPCAPSLSDSLLGTGSVVAGLTGQGYAVAVPDYQGLGIDGVHPYSDARTAGFNMIDAVRALRHTFKKVSNRWAAFGGSQGGGAAWSADEQARGYAPELQLVGAVAVSPAADVSGIVDKAQQGTLTSDQGPVMQLLVESLARLHQDLNRDDFRRGAALKYWDVLSACSGAAVHDRTAAANALGPDDFKPRSPEAAEQLRQLLQKWALPQQPLSAPLSVVYGTKDTLVDPQWTTDAIARACALGGTVVWDLQPDKGHGDVDFSAQVTWLADRFTGKPVASECP